MRDRAFFQAGVAVTLWLTGWSNLSACSCNRVGPVCDAAWTADAVFVGVVDHIEPWTIFGIPLAWPFSTERRVTFAVKESFRGSKEQTIEIGTDSGCCACGIDFQRGRAYLVYAYRNPTTKMLSTSICTRTSFVGNAAADLAYLRSLATSPPPARVYGFITTHERDQGFGDKATEPLPAVPVHLRSDAREWKTMTDGAGAFDFPMLPGGTFMLSPELPRKLGIGPSRAIHLAEHGCSRQILVAVEQGELRGRVLDDGGLPVQTQVAMVPVGQNKRRKAVSGYSMTDGTFTIGNIGPGDYYLGVNLSEPPRLGSGITAPWPPTYYPGVQDQVSAKRLHIDSAQRLQGFEFRLPPRLKQRTITGVVEWVGGKHAMAFVELKDDAFENNVDLGNSARDGTFTMTGVVGRP